jgi:hypothetical protein
MSTSRLTRAARIWRLLHDPHFLWRHGGLTITNAARKLGCGHAAARSAFRELEDAGMITMTLGYANLYTIRVTELGRGMAPPVRTTKLSRETLTCSACGQDFERWRTTGRKPHRCPACETRQRITGRDQ